MPATKRGEYRHDLADLAPTPQTSTVHPHRARGPRRADDPDRAGHAPHLRQVRTAGLRAQVGPCRAGPSHRRDLQHGVQPVQQPVQNIGHGGRAVPRPAVLVGLFWGAPLVAREIEHGTHRLVWTQGVSRQHWALVKFGLVGTATLSAAVVYGLGMSWWLTPLSQAGQARLGVFFFDMQGLVPIFLALPVFYGVTSTGLYQLRSVARRVGGR